MEVLKWVRDDIENFGGNFNKVIIFGVSVGGLSVGFYLLLFLLKEFFY